MQTDQFVTVLETLKTILDVDVGHSFIAVLYDGEFDLYNSEFEKVNSFNINFEIKRVLCYRFVSVGASTCIDLEY